MYVVSPEIRLDPHGEWLSFEPADWQRHGQLLFHAPTRAVFVVIAPPHNGDRVSIFDIAARLVYVRMIASMMFGPSAHFTTMASRVFSERKRKSLKRGPITSMAAATLAISITVPGSG